MSCREGTKNTVRGLPECLAMGDVLLQTGREVNFGAPRVRELSRAIWGLRLAEAGATLRAVCNNGRARIWGLIIGDLLRHECLCLSILMRAMNFG